MRERPMQRWEYQIVMRARTVAVRGPSGFTHSAGNKEISDWAPDSAGMHTQLAALGDEGWELVNVYPRVSAHPSPATTEEIWVFKRPKE